MSATSERQQSGAARSAMMGAVFAADATGHCFALATICFGGALTAGLGLATGLFLFGSCVATVFLFRWGRLPIALGITQDTTISILAPAILLATSQISGSEQARVATAFAVIGTSALCSGVVFWAVGRLGLGRLVRMFPFPVAAGFLASSGYLLVYAGFAIVTHATGLPAIASALSNPFVQLAILSALAMAIALILAIRFIGGTAPVLIIIALFLAGFYVVSFGFGLTNSDLIDMGWLPPSTPSGQHSLSLAMFEMIDWSAVFHILPVIAAVVFLNLLGILLNVSGVELATRADVDENHELRVSGAANILIGMCGGLTAYLQGGASIMLAKMGVHRSALVFGYLATMSVAAFMAPVIVAVVPIFIPAALVMFIGFSMLQDWLMGTRRRLTPVDWLIVISIVLATAVFGVLPAIGIGLVLAVLGFAYAAIRLPIIRHSTTVAVRRSIRDRNALQSEVLRREGHRIRILHLEGLLFFGSVERMILHLRQITGEVSRVEAVVIDFTEVYSFDSSACAALEKMFHFLRARGVAAHLTGVSPGLLSVFSRWGLPISTDVARMGLSAFGLWSSLDEAIEHCETVLLSQMQTGAGEADVQHLLSELGNHHPRVPELLGLMTKQTLAAGKVLMHAKDTTTDVYIVDRGRLGILLQTANGAAVRVRAMGPGSIVGEVAYLTGRARNADVVCEEETSVMCLTEKTLQRIAHEDRDMAALIMFIFSRSLAAKLDLTNGFLTYGQHVVSVDLST